MIHFTRKVHSMTTSRSITSVTESNYQSEIAESELPVLIDFWAPWCGPCRTLEPLIAQTAIDFAGKLKVVKVDIDVAKELAKSYAIRSIPTLVIIKKGQAVARIQNASRTRLFALLEEQLQSE